MEDLTKVKRGKKLSLANSPWTIQLYIYVLCILNMIIKDLPFSYYKKQKSC